MATNLEVIFLGIVATAAIISHLLMIGSWKKTIEACIEKERDRIDRLFARDEKLFEKLESMAKSMHNIELWIARQEGPVKK